MKSSRDISSLLRTVSRVLGLTLLLPPGTEQDSVRSPALRYMNLYLRLAVLASLHPKPRKILLSSFPGIDGKSLTRLRHQAVTGTLTGGRGWKDGMLP